MKTQIGLLLLMLMITVGCDNSPQTQQPVEQSTEQGFDLEGSSVDERSDEAEQPTKPVPVDPPVVELPSITNSIGMKLKLIPAGTFLMGTPADEKHRALGIFVGQDEKPQHKVTISKAFYMQTTEVTQAQWKAVMGTEPWKGPLSGGVQEGANYPASCLSWNSTDLFCKKLSEMEEKTYRLPTEAEWEYACRAGTKTTWSFGDDAKKIVDYAWCRENQKRFGDHSACQVGLKTPNAYGLYDMYGNLKEWCRDFYGRDYYEQSPATDPQGPESGYSHVLRGGCQINSAKNSRSAKREMNAGGEWFYGFRIVCEAD